MNKFLNINTEIKNMSKLGNIVRSGNFYRVTVNGEVIELLALPNNCGIAHIRAAGTYWLRVKYAVQAVS